ncbi:PiggyBac transposable element-derived protein 1 [Trichinella pseudospiralis]|uniref:PiggyBac transposable element-derived protein 1 n=1 Tax=Trichinella pseudospiralis TaxID=6337 RepID=A0A0V0Y7V6_TRIPS|nr:PiggyBac transposable element-derived protein 1 [Trichinella pseudospiralis]
MFCLRPVAYILYSVATIRSNRLRDCPVVPLNEVKRRGRGAIDFCRTKDNDKLCVVKWFDNREVILASTYKGVDPVQPVRRWDKRQRQFIDVSCPEIVTECNQFIRGVDFTRMYKLDHKYHRRVFVWTMHILVINDSLNIRKIVLTMVLRPKMS